MTERTVLHYLEDILEAIARIQAYTLDMTQADFEADMKTVDAVIRRLEVIGEAAKNFPTAICVSHAAIPWRDMAGMRDRLIHSYFGVDLEVVWIVAREELPSLEHALSSD